MAEAGPGSAGGYVAFISYSHKDSAMGQWLHRKLEGYRLPKRLVGTKGEDGEVPERLTPIFRDRTSLPAAGDLSERVRAALAVSRKLIVVCSPNSAASSWVAKEIATFRELHPGRPILTAIIDGEPGQCFSPALLEGGVEPLAADLRKEGDGRRLGLLKLVAGVAGVGLDALVQRDAARRVRRVTYLTAVALTATLAMALLTAFAFSARAESQRQRAEAEGLVEFMLTDLRTKLKGVGRIDALAIANQRILAFYTRQRLEDLPADSLERRAKILHAIGEDDISTANFAAAQRAFLEAHRTTASILADAPDNPQRIFNHGQSEYWLGYVHELRRNWPQAQAFYVRYGNAAERLIDRDPRNPDYMLEMAWAASNRGVVARDGTGDQEAAELLFKSAIAWFRKAIAVRPRPGDWRDLANTYGNLADSFHKRGLWGEALKARLSAKDIIENLYRDDPTNQELSYRLAIAGRAAAHEQARGGDSAGARPLMRGAYQRISALTKFDSRNQDWVLLKAKIECDMLNPSLALDMGSTRQIRRGLSASVTALKAQANPRVAELGNCARQ